MNHVFSVVCKKSLLKSEIFSLCFLFYVLQFLSFTFTFMIHFWISFPIWCDIKNWSPFRVLWQFVKMLNRMPCDPVSPTPTYTSKRNENKYLYKKQYRMFEGAFFISAKKWNNPNTHQHWNYCGSSMEWNNIQQLKWNIKDK